MSTLIYKKANTAFIKKEVCFEMVFERPYYMTVAYADGKKVHIEKFKSNTKDKSISIEAGWKKLESLTEYPAIMLFYSGKEHIFEKNINNLPPVILENGSAYISVGTILALQKKSKKLYSDAFFFKDYAFDKMNEMCPNLFFTFHGSWLLKQIIPTYSAMAFIKPDGEVSLIYKEGKSDTFKGMWYFDTLSARQKK